MKGFREFYCEKYQRETYPAEKGEPIHKVMERIAEALADWADEIARGLR